MSRRYGVPIFGPSKSLERKNYPPGMHGPKVPGANNPSMPLRSGKNRSCVINMGCWNANSGASFENALRKRGVTGETLLQLLETRLDNVVYPSWPG